MRTSCELNDYYYGSRSSSNDLPISLTFEVSRPLPRSPTPPRRASLPVRRPRATVCSMVTTRAFRIAGVSDAIQRVGGYRARPRARDETLR